MYSLAMPDTGAVGAVGSAAKAKALARLKVRVLSRNGFNAVSLWGQGFGNKLGRRVAEDQAYHTGPGPDTQGCKRYVSNVFRPSDCNQGGATV